MNTAAKSPASPSVYITFSGIVIWTAEAAREHVRICRLRGEPTIAQLTGTQLEVGWALAAYDACNDLVKS